MKSRSALCLATNGDKDWPGRDFIRFLDLEKTLLVSGIWYLGMSGVWVSGLRSFHFQTIMRICTRSPQGPFFYLHVGYRFVNELKRSAFWHQESFGLKLKQY